MKNQMRKSMLALAVVGGIAFGGQAFAQDCASPIQIHSDEHGVTGDTCAAGNPLPSYGGVGSPQNEIIYSFVAQSANATITIAQTGGYAGSSALAVLLPACTPSTDLIQFGAPGSPMPVSGLTDGQTYYIAVTADPGGPNDGCGAYTIDVDGTLPVSLQSFSVD